METITTASMSDERHFSITETVQQFGKRLFGFVRGKVKTTEEAEDILQDVWYQFSRLSNLDELENVSAWLYRVAQNRVTDNYRKKKTENLEDFTYENDENEISFKEILLLEGFGSSKKGALVPKSSILEGVFAIILFDKCLLIIY